jgi:hypothetical protein
MEAGYCRDPGPSRAVAPQMIMMMTLCLGCLLRLIRGSASSITESKCSITLDVRGLLFHAGNFIRLTGLYFVV